VAKFASMKQLQKKSDRPDPQVSCAIALCAPTFRVTVFHESRWPVRKGNRDRSHTLSMDYIVPGR
jgi:hypothetical protein